VALQGTLDAFGLAEVLQLLAATEKTGCLRVEGDGGQGEVWLRDGRVTAASSAQASGPPLDEIICELLRNERGSFTFEIDHRTPDAAGAEDVDDLLDRADMLLAEWRELTTVVPSLHDQVTLVERLAERREVTVNKGQWPALVAVGRGCTVGDLADTLSLTELSALRMVHDLVTSGLTTVHPGRRTAQRRSVGRQTRSGTR
jgi:hypothetical protein